MHPSLPGGSFPGEARRKKYIILAVPGWGKELGNSWEMAQPLDTAHSVVVGSVIMVVPHTRGTLTWYPSLDHEHPIAYSLHSLPQC